MRIIFTVCNDTNSSFCNLASLPHSNPQHVIPNWIWDKINESYMIFNADNSKYRFKQFITTRVWQILLAIFTECDPQFMNSFIVIPRKLNSVTLSIGVLLISSCGISLSVMSFCFGSCEKSWISFYLYLKTIYWLKAIQIFLWFLNWLASTRGWYHGNPHKWRNITD